MELGAVKKQIFDEKKISGSWNKDSIWRELAIIVLQEYGIDGRLLQANKSLYSWLGVCVHVGGVKQQPFTILTKVNGLQQGCTITTLHSLYEMDIHWLPSQRRFATVKSCKVNRLLVSDDFLLVAFSQQVQHALGRLAAACF